MFFQTLLYFFNHAGVAVCNGLEKSVLVNKYIPKIQHSPESTKRVEKEKPKTVDLVMKNEVKS